MRLIWYGLLTAIGLLLMTVSPYAAPPFDKLLADLGQFCLEIAAVVK